MDSALIINDKLPIRGEVHLTLVRGDVSAEETQAILDDCWGRTLARRIVRRVVVPNLITNTGRADFTTRIIGSAAVVPTNLAVGTAAIVPAVTDTVLAGELMRKALTTTSAFATYFLRYAVTFTTTDFNNTVLGMALFSAAAVGDMFAIVSTNVLKDSTLALVCDWRINVTSP